MTKTNTKAFTLIELLIVIVIIGILAVALIPRLTGAQASARDAARQASVQQVATAVSQAIAENSGTGATDLVNAGYLSSYPLDPKGAAYGAIEINAHTSGNLVVCANVERTQKGNSSSTGTSATPNGTSGDFYCQLAR